MVDAGVVRSTTQGMHVVSLVTLDGSRDMQRDVTGHFFSSLVPLPGAAPVSINQKIGTANRDFTVFR
jgi:hypothetical protein